MKRWAFIVCAAATGAASLICSANAAAAPKHVLVSEVWAKMVQRAKALPSKKRLTGWVRPASSTTTPLIYVSLGTGVATGQTNIYQQSAGTLQLVGQLPEGGGPIAVDNAQNVYVAEMGDVSTNGGYPPRRIFVYARGATTPKLILQNTLFTTDTIAVARDGTVYAAGPQSDTQQQMIMKWAPGASTGTLLPADPVKPWVPASIAVDSSGNLIVGVEETLPDLTGASQATGTPCVVLDGIEGCTRELASGSNTWTAFLPYGGAANAINVGPMLGNGESVVEVDQREHYAFLVAFPNGSTVPSRVISVPPSVELTSMTFGSDTSSIWVTKVFTPTIWELGYPSGSLLMTFQIPQSPPGLPLYNDIAVSPAYYPN